MLTERAVVIAYEQGKATVKCQSKSACGQCAAKSACGTAALSELTGENPEHIFTVDSIMPLKLGQIVELGLQESSLISTALLLYIVPLMTLLSATLLASQVFKQELWSAIFILFCTALSFIFIRSYSKKWQSKKNFQPILLRIIQ